MTRNAIRDRVKQEMAQIDGIWDLRVQLDLEAVRRSDRRMEGGRHPSEEFATITVPHPGYWAEDRVPTVNEEMQFNSFQTGLAAHQPLGNINRARRTRYQHLAKFRECFNRCRPEPAGKRPHRSKQCPSSLLSGRARGIHGLRCRRRGQSLLLL